MGHVKGNKGLPGEKRKENKKTAKGERDELYCLC